MIEGLDPIESRPRSSASPQPLIVDHIARLCADALADLCAVYVRSSPGGPVAFFTRVPGEFAALREATFDDLYTERAREAGIDRLVYQPLVVEGTTIGSVILGTSASNLLTEVTPAIAQTVSAILSSAMAQASQLSFHHRVSERLQRAMLPERLVQVDGLAFDAAYRPASRDAEVGGDWYDAFEAGNGKIGISVGDVTGHGLEAAVTMSEIRGAIRAAAAMHGSPAALINAVETMVSAQGLGVASAIVGIFDPATRVLRYACAGHPPPVLVTAKGDAYLLPGGGLLLGLGQPAASPERTITIAPGASCFFYTDGLTEHERDLLAGEERLLAAIEYLAQRDLISARDLHAQIIGDAANLDDCATLVLRLHDDEAAPLERYTFSALPSSARLARDSIRSYAERRGVAPVRAFDLILAAGEAVANAIEYGARGPETTFSVELSTSEDGVVVRVESDGHWRSSPSHEDRGRGIAIMRACAKHVEVSSTSERTLLTLAFTV